MPRTVSATTLANAVCPGIVHPQVRYKELLRKSLQPHVRWLDLGCGHNVIRPWALLPGENELSYTTASSVCVGVDRDVSALSGNKCIECRVAAHMEFLPFSDNSFDLVTANMVLEHSENPQSLMTEVWRVLRPNGRFIFHTPNKYFPASIVASFLPKHIKSGLVELFTLRRAKDVYPTYYRVNTRSEIVRCSQRIGFDVEQLDVLESLTYSPYRALFLSNLIMARLLRWKALKKFQADFLVTLSKPSARPASEPAPARDANDAAQMTTSAA
jgi:2-polyprenyl-3-methyl-5-hydroxy-6-metoxy-1,4-benzoquinol methylase